VRERTLHQLLDYALLVQEATRRGFDRSDELSVAMVIELAHRLELQVQATVDPLALPEADLRAYYAAHHEKFAIAPLRRATYVRVPTRAEASALVARARRMSISDFRDLALARVDDGTGAELPYVDESGRPSGVPVNAPLDATLVQRAFALDELGEVSEPFEHGGGFVVLRITGRTEGAGNRFEDAVDQVREALAAERVQHAQDALEQRLRREHAVEVHPELSDASTLDAEPPLGIPAGFPAAPPDPRAPTITVEPDDA
jgi:parvulin-like peptidyl-prolyl isomerase